MESSVLIAIITAITSIVVAVIQMTVSLRVARLKEPPVQPGAVPVQPGSPVKTLSANRTWLWIGSILVISNFLWPLYLHDESGYIVPLGAIPWCTCLLAYFRPIRWGYVAGVVTLINVFAVVSAYLHFGGDISQFFEPIFSFPFVINAILAAGIAYLRQRNSVTS
ncbi:MAG TPA: hypothetical protein VK206_24025 [Anaerolineales bacterium]|nr:hypothetical protein [Anaerolineales bacterium]